MKKIKAALRTAIFLPTICHFLFFYLKFLNNGRESDYPKLRSTAFWSNGMSLNIAHSLAMRKYAQNQIWNQKSTGILKISETDIIDAGKFLKEFGYWVAPNPIEEKLLEGYYSSAVENLFKIKKVESNSGDIETIADSWDQDMVNLETQWVLDQKLTLDIASSPDIIRIATEYLGVAPILNHPGSWFSFPVKKVSKGSAKNWHWDCDGIKWLKIFVYINDVNLDNGPHAFVSGSHQNWLVNDRSSRVSEEKILDAYGQHAIKIFTAPRGTVIFEDTRGFHRGTPLLSNHRLVLEIQFNLDIFALDQSKTIVLPESYSKAFGSSPYILQYLNKN